MNRTSLALATLALLALTPAANAATAKKGRFAGSLGVKVLKGAHADVRAVNRADGTIAAVGTVRRSGSFSLSLPAGAYVVVGTVVPRPSRRRFRVTQIRTGVTLKAGQKRSKANIRKARRKKSTKRRKAGRSGARAAYVQELGQVTPGRTAVSIEEFTGSATGEWGAVTGGLNDLMISDIAGGPANDCDLTVIASGRDRQAILQELEFQQSRYVDPATRVRRNFIIGDVEVRGTISDAPGGRATVDVRIVDSRTGQQHAQLSETFGPDDFFDAFERFTRQAGRELCKLRESYEVTLDVRGDGIFATHTSAGTIRSTLRARLADPQRPVWRDSGPLAWQNVSFASKVPPCVYIDPVVPGTSWSVTILDGGGGNLQVTWGLQGPDATTASIDCPPSGPGEPDPPPIPGQPGPSLISTGPDAFEVPYAGGVQAISGVIADGGDGFFNTGTITVKPGGLVSTGG